MKRGEESGYIKISLRGDTEDEQITIMRKIDTRNKSEWLFNGRIPLYLCVSRKMYESDFTHDIYAYVKIMLFEIFTKHSP